MKELSHAILNSKKSSIRKLFELLIQSGPDAISFGIGQPDFNSPDFLNDAIIQALRENKTKYAPAMGIPQLRDMVAYKFKSENNLKWVEKENVIITNGGSQALQLAYAVLSNPGDEIIINSPAFLSYYYLAEYYGLNCVEVPRLADYSPNIEGIKKVITPKTKFIIINSPSNPTGYVLNKDEIDSIVDIVKENDLYLISDEVYEKFIYEDAVHISPASYDGMAERTVTINAVSKTFAGTGLRLGYVAANKEIILNMEKYIQYTTAGVNHPIQYGGIAGLKNIKKLHLDKIVESYNEKRKICIDRLKKMQFEVIEPKGAFYIMPKLNKDWNISAEEFSNELVKEKHVACVAGDGFGSFSKDAIRISYATSNKQLEEGFNRIELFLQERNLI